MADSLPKEMLDENTPKEVIVTDTPREPAWDPTLGIDVEVSANGQPRNRLVTIGDSLTHGFQSGAIYNTDISFPAITAREMGWQSFFRYPTYDLGGLPLNLELLIHELEKEFGERLELRELLLTLHRARLFLEEREAYWERGAGSRVPNTRGINHNLGVYGWDLRDTLEKTADVLKKPRERGI